MEDDDLPKTTEEAIDNMLRKKKKIPELENFKKILESPDENSDSLFQSFDFS
jgi:hypothetical protein